MTATRWRHPLRHTPLRIKLVALLLVLLTLAIALIGIASNLAMRNYLTSRLDSQLQEAEAQLRTTLLRTWNQDYVPLLPSDFVIYFVDESGQWQSFDFKGRPDEMLPVLPEPDQLQDAVGTFLSLDAPAKDAPKWRVRVFELRGQPWAVARSLEDVERVRNNLFLINVYGGVAVLVLAASIGTELIRRSMRPLTSIEKTAGAIAGGDLTQRVVDPEDDQPQPRTEVGSLARSLNSMLIQIESAFTAKADSERSARAAEEKMRQFVADASHELRTPLTTIRGFAELYRQGAVSGPEPTADLLRRIESEAQRMGLLVEDLLLLARLDQERPIQLAPVELRVLAAEAVQGARAIAADRRIELSIAKDTGDLVVAGDDARLRQVIGNLMSNALAHTPAGTPIELRLATAGDDALLEVVDHGPGLDAEQRTRVFERFYRTDNARTRRANGQVSTGLGLAIVAALVTAHHGTVEVDSAAGQGSTFRVKLPLAILSNSPDRIQSRDSTRRET